MIRPQTYFGCQPLKHLSCTCCGKDFRGRQWWNQDTGHGLGPCCVEFTTGGMNPAAIRETYGLSGIHYNADPQELPNVRARRRNSTQPQNPAPG